MTVAHNVHCRSISLLLRCTLHTKKRTHAHTPNQTYSPIRGPPNYHTTRLYTQGSLHFRGQSVRRPGKGPRKDEMLSVVWWVSRRKSSFWMAYKYTHICLLAYLVLTYLTKAARRRPLCSSQPHSNLQDSPAAPCQRYIIGWVLGLARQIYSDVPPPLP